MKINKDNFPFLPDDYLKFCYSLNKVTNLEDKDNSVEWNFIGSQTEKNLLSEVSINRIKVPFYKQATLIMQEALAYGSCKLKDQLEGLNYQNTFTVAEYDLNQLFFTERSELWIELKLILSE